MESEVDPFVLLIFGRLPPQTENDVPRDFRRDRPTTQTRAVSETTAVGLDLAPSKSASKSSIDNLPRVEIPRGKNDDAQCVVCLEEWKDGEEVKEMPCEHRFHGECIEKWLRINGCCPVCRHQMPVDERC